MRRRMSRAESLRRLGCKDVCPDCGGKMMLGAITCRDCRKARLAAERAAKKIEKK